MREACDRRDWAAAATALLRSYGSELAGFLGARLRDPDLVAEAFSELGEDIWRGLPKFAWRSTARVWAYTLARHAAVRVAAAPHRRRERNLPLSGGVELAAMAEEARSQTAEYLRTDVKDRFRALRQRLPLEDQSLLVLRVDKKMSWRDLALVMAGEGAAFDEDGVTREAARWRKRYQQLKTRLRALAAAEGIVVKGSWTTR